MKIFISMPMKGLSESEIAGLMTDYANQLHKVYPDAVFIDSLIRKEELNESPVYNLGTSIQMLSQADLVFFAHGWYSARGCRIEREVCIEYDIKTMYEEELDYGFI